MAGAIKSRAFGFGEQSRIHRAVTKVIRAAKVQGCNCLQLTQVLRNAFIGLPSVKIVAHARHIQISRCFHDVLDYTGDLIASASVRSRKWDF